MAEFREVMENRNRMCNRIGADCTDCPLYEISEGACESYMIGYPQEAEEIIMKWAEEHPIKTNKDKFKEIFGIDISSSCCPYAETKQCPNVMGGQQCDCTCKHYDFWEQEYKEPEESEEKKEKMTEIKIYDHSNREITVPIPAKPIDHIYIEVISGDEVGHIVFADGETLSFDASVDDRMMNFFDGNYIVEKNKINEWAEMPAQIVGRAISYKRLDAFEDNDDDDDE